MPAERAQRRGCGAVDGTGGRPGLITRRDGWRGSGHLGGGYWLRFIFECGRGLLACSASRMRQTADVGPIPRGGIMQTADTDPELSHCSSLPAG